MILMQVWDSEDVGEARVVCATATVQISAFVCEDPSRALEHIEVCARGAEEARVRGLVARLWDLLAAGRTTHLRAPVGVEEHRDFERDTREWRGYVRGSVEVPVS